MYNLEKMAELDKVAFEPMPGGQMQQPVDPAAQGAPVDPAAQGAPVDPSMAAGGGAPAASLPPPAAAPAAPAPASPDASGMDAMVQAVRQVMMEMGVGGQPQGKGGKGGADNEERLSAIEAALAQVLQALNLASPDQAVADAVSANAKQTGKGMTAGSGQADPGAGTVAASGPMDPNASAVMGQLKPPTTVSGVKMGSARPLDGATKASQLASALKKVRG